jgi:hypothetical protein
MSSDILKARSVLGENVCTDMYIILYHYRAVIEGIFGAEENKHHQLYCRFGLKNNQILGLIKGSELYG